MFRGFGVHTPPLKKKQKQKQKTKNHNLQYFKFRNFAAVFLHISLFFFLHSVSKCNRMSGLWFFSILS